MITQENKTILANRTKSFLWRLGGMVGVAVLGFVSANLELFDLPIWSITIIGLVVGELTKFLNSTK